MGSCPDTDIDPTFLGDFRVNLCSMSVSEQPRTAYPPLP